MLIYTGEKKRFLVNVVVSRVSSVWMVKGGQLSTTCLILLQVTVSHNYAAQPAKQYRSVTRIAFAALSYVLHTCSSSPITLSSSTIHTERKKCTVKSTNVDTTAVATIYIYFLFELYLINFDGETCFVYTRGNVFICNEWFI